MTASDPTVVGDLATQGEMLQSCCAGDRDVDGRPYKHLNLSA
jgi:hypothetical protein